MNVYPKVLEELIEGLKRIPGIGTRTAERYALSMLKLRNDELDLISDNIKKLKTTLKVCKNCGSLTDQDLCSICKDERRNKNLICVVEDYKSVFMFEKTGKYRGTYHVLNGLISPIDGINPSDLNIKSLIIRCSNNSEIEVVIALKPSIEGETTTLYLQKILKDKGIKISRLSYGIPMGAELDYLDVSTLERAFNDRKEM